jgi:hypothetical protein
MLIDRDMRLESFPRAAKVTNCTRLVKKDGPA